MRPARDLKPCDRAGLIVELCRNQHDPCVIYHQGKVCRVMPAWMEILINVIGYAGFIAVATCHKSPGEKFPDR